jgi:hypothetical protein
LLQQRLPLLCLLLLLLLRFLPLVLLLSWLQLMLFWRLHLLRAHRCQHLRLCQLLLELLNGRLILAVLLGEEVHQAVNLQIHKGRDRHQLFGRTNPFFKCSASTHMQESDTDRSAAQPHTWWMMPASTCAAWRTPSGLMCSMQTSSC